MQITAVFESMEEVIEFSKRMLGNSVSQENSDVNPAHTDGSPVHLAQGWKNSFRTLHPLRQKKEPLLTNWQNLKLETIFIPRIFQK